jgi:hypothetical protein
MSRQRMNPSPLAGEGGARRRRGAGEGTLTRTKVGRGLRIRMTDAERKLWFASKDRRFAAFKFRRQVPIGQCKSGDGVEQDPSPVVSLTLDATLSRKGRGKEDRAMSLLVPKIVGAR